nr:hypothetical protein HmN_000523100 [Hymenolepis microstoma]
MLVRELKSSGNPSLCTYLDELAEVADKIQEIFVHAVKTPIPSPSNFTTTWHPNKPRAENAIYRVKPLRS